MAETRRFSQSEMKVFTGCKRRWWLSEYRRLAPIGYDPTGPLRSGTRVHTALEAFYTPGQDAFWVLSLEQEDDWDTYVRNCAERGEDTDASVAEQFRKDCQLEKIMLEGYGEWIAESGEDAGLETIAIEEIVTVPGSAFAPELVAKYYEFDVVGKLDARVRRLSDGARKFVDHKTAASLTMTLPTLQMNPQMKHYRWLESMTTPEGERADGALYNVLKKVKRTKAAKPPFFARYEVNHNQEEIDNYEKRMKRIIAQILELEAELVMTPIEEQPHVAYPTPDETCSWKCQFFELCNMFDDGSRAEDMIRDQFTTRDPLARYAEGKAEDA